MKLLTIAVPAYNMEHWLDRCLSSLDDIRLERELEVIVVDDGSTDDTLSVARRYERRRPEVFRAVTQKNGGHGAAVNKGLQLATGKYFRIVDADDWVNPEELLTELEHMSSVDCDLFVDERTEVDVTTHKITRLELPQIAKIGEKLPFSSITGKEFEQCLSMHTMSARTSLLRDIHLTLMEHTFYVDMQYVIGVGAFAQSVFLMRERVYNYQVGDAGQSVYYLNCVKRYDQHDRVLKGCIDFCDRNAAHLPEGRVAYLNRALALLARTQLKIALIFDPDKKQGRTRARALSRELSKGHPEIWKLVRSRMVSGMALNRLGVGYEQLEKLNEIRKRIGQR